MTISHLWWFVVFWCLWCSVGNMSVQYMRDILRQWLKDWPLFSHVIEKESFVWKYWELAQNSLKKSSMNEMLLWLSVTVYCLIEALQHHFCHACVQLSRLSKKLLSLIEKSLVSSVDNIGSSFNGVSIKFLNQFVDALRKFKAPTIFRNEEEGGINPCSSAKRLFKNFAIGASQATRKLLNVYNMANNVALSQIEMITLTFVDSTEVILEKVNEVYNNNDIFLLTSFSTYPKSMYMFNCLLQFAELFMEYLSSLFALDIEIELEWGWLDLDAEDFVVIDSVVSRRKLRAIGHH